jgi:uncharacterized damage-inducible protein DinB
MNHLDQERATFLLHEVYLPSLKREHVLTRRLIEALPQGQEDYRPHPVANSALELIWHIVGAESRFLEAVVNGGFDSTSVTIPGSIRHSAEVGDWYSKRFEANVESLETLSGNDQLRMIPFRGVERPAIFLLQIGLNHSIHHRGQLSMYLRTMNARVPSIYGESYDDKKSSRRS